MKNKQSLFPSNRNKKLYSLKDFQKQLDKWVYKKRYRLMLLLLVGLTLFAANYIPYINLFSNTYLIILVLLSLTPLILDIDGKIFIGIGLLLFVITFLIWFVGQTEEAEVLANYVFIFFLSGSLKSLL